MEGYRAESQAVLQSVAVIFFGHFSSTPANQSAMAAKSLQFE